MQVHNDYIFSNVEDIINVTTGKDKSVEIDEMDNEATYSVTLTSRDIQIFCRCVG